MDKLKILYAASNSTSSKIQLERFLLSIKDKPYKIKIAAYRKSSPNQSIDWTLDCLQNIFKPSHISLDNDNFETYFNQVKNYAPDLIISDLEYFTSHIASVLNIILWQCNSSLINFALTQNQKYNLGLFKQFYYLFHKIPLNNQRIMNMIDNSNCNFVYSHLGDATNLTIKDNFEWIRPYHTLGTSSIISKHNLVAGILQPNKKILNLLQKHSDSVIFTEDCNEEYSNITLKDLNNHDEYICNLNNSSLFVCAGQTNFLADAYYNGKFSLIMPDYNDIECVINSVSSEHEKLSKTIHDSTEDIEDYKSLVINVNYNSDIKFLHERIESI